jgi:hypothetical protein
MPPKNALATGATVL